jgi:C_GCAxxG_C_C family probable redox protein
LNKANLALARFEKGFSCSQSVFSAFAPTFGLDHEVALKVAGAFGGGMGRMGETCGAVTGALMVIGLKYGHTVAEDKRAKEQVYELASEFAARFRARNEGRIMCRELLGCAIDTPEGLYAAREKGLFKVLCPKYVGDAAALVEELCDEQHVTLVMRS